MQTQEALSFTELILNASLLVQCVMLFLLALSIISWTIIFSRNNQYRIGRAKAEEFEDKFWSGIDLNNLYQECMKRSDYLVGLEVIYSSGFKEFVRLVNSGPADQEVVMDGTYRQMKVACSREIELLESHLPTLATIGSISPYIGLFGTVWGIMHAFVSLAAVKNATLSMVAPPIAEALIATAMGLFAAIPAVMFYNRFTTKVEALENRYYNFIDEFSTILNRRLVTIRSQFNRQQAASAQMSGASSQQVGSLHDAAQNADGGNYEQDQRMVSEYEDHSSGINQNGGGMDSSQDMSRSAKRQNNLSSMGSGSSLNSLQAQQALHNAVNNTNVSGPLPVQMKSNPMDNSGLTSNLTTGGAHISNPTLTGSGFNSQATGQVMGGNQQLSSNYKVRQSQMPINNMANNANYNMAYRGVVPPPNPVNNMTQAQLPGGPASAVKPQIKDDQPLYKTGVDFERRRQKVNNEEPHYIAPNSRRNSNTNSGGSM